MVSSSFFYLRAMGFFLLRLEVIKDAKEETLLKMDNQLENVIRNVVTDFKIKDPKFYER